METELCELAVTNQFSIPVRAKAKDNVSKQNPPPVKQEAGFHHPKKNQSAFIRVP